MQKCSVLDVASGAEAVSRAQLEPGAKNKTSWRLVSEDLDRPLRDNEVIQRAQAQETVHIPDLM
jgi:hypothetical protein